MANKQVWRMVGGEAILCSECSMNLEGFEDGNDICTATDEICVFVKKKIDSQKTWEDFKEAYKETAQ